MERGSCQLRCGERQMHSVTSHTKRCLSRSYFNVDLCSHRNPPPMQKPNSHRAILYAFSAKPSIPQATANALSVHPGWETPLMHLLYPNVKTPYRPRRNSPSVPQSRPPTPTAPQPSPPATPTQTPTPSPPAHPANNQTPSPDTPHWPPRP